MEANGDYEITVSKNDYTEETTSVRLECDKSTCTKCSIEKTVKLDQTRRCANISFPVTVTDFHNHEKPIEKAKVELVLLQTLAGVTNKVLDTLHTNDQVPHHTTKLSYNTFLRVWLPLQWK